jgi:hypothetical protein
MPLVRSRTSSHARRRDLFRSHDHFQPRLDLHPVLVKAAVVAVIAGFAALAGATAKHGSVVDRLNNVMSPESQQIAA